MFSVESNEIMLNRYNAIQLHSNSFWSMTTSLQDKRKVVAFSYLHCKHCCRKAQMEMGSCDTAFLFRWLIGSNISTDERKSIILYLKKYSHRNFFLNSDLMCTFSPFMKHGWHLLIFVIYVRNFLYHCNYTIYPQSSYFDHFVTPLVPFSAKLPIHQNNSVCWSAPDILLQLEASSNQLFSNNDLLLQWRDTGKPVNLLNSINSLSVHEGVPSARNHTFEISLNSVLSNWTKLFLMHLRIPSNWTWNKYSIRARYWHSR